MPLSYQATYVLLLLVGLIWVGLKAADSLGSGSPWPEVLLDFGLRCIAVVGVVFAPTISIWVGMWVYKADLFLGYPSHEAGLYGGAVWWWICLPAAVALAAAFHLFSRLRNWLVEWVEDWWHDRVNSRPPRGNSD